MTYKEIVKGKVYLHPEVKEKFEEQKKVSWTGDEFMVIDALDASLVKTKVGGKFYLVYDEDEVGKDPRVKKVEFKA